MKAYEIWIGYYDFGQCGSSKAPQKVATIEAVNFKTACLLYEHLSAIEFINEQSIKDKSHSDSTHFGQWYYKSWNNSNDWTGKYFETEEEAQKTFK